MLNKTPQNLSKLKNHMVSKALEKSFKMGPIPSLQLNSFGYSIEKSARGSKIEIAKKVGIDGENKLPCQLQCYTVSKRKELEKRDCTQIKDLSKSFNLLMYFFNFDQDKPIKQMLEVIFVEKFSLNFGLLNHATSI